VARRQQRRRKGREPRVGGLSNGESGYGVIRFRNPGTDRVMLSATRAAALGIFSCLILGTTLPAMADAPASTAEQSRLLQLTLKHPGDYDATFAYVRVSEALGDYEAAIGALERLLFYNSKLTRVKYELGTLYYRMHSYQMAANYFRQALASPDLDADTRARIEAYLPGAEKELKPVRSWLFVQTGIRYQSNASFTPWSDTIEVGGGSFPIDLSGAHGPDWNDFALAQFANDIDFGNQAGDKLETRLTGYATGQFKLDQLNVGYLSGSIGPRFALAPSLWNGLTVKPYLTGTAAWVGGDEYDTSGGVGVSLSAPFGKALTISPFVEWQRANYPDTDPSQPLGTADWLTTGASASLRLSDAVTLNASFGYQRADAVNPWQSNNQFTEEFDLPIRFDPPAASIGQKWTATPFAIFTQTGFDEPNDFIDPGVTRRDSSWQVGLAIDAPLTAHLGLSGAISYQRNDSNISNYSYDNWMVLGGPTARF
jgi:hypothetical protein